MRIFPVSVVQLLCRNWFGSVTDGFSLPHDSKVRIVKGLGPRCCTNKTGDDGHLPDAEVRIYTQLLTESNG